MSAHRHTWWKDATVYQIYPASFKDSNNDGLGDIPGIISKLDYLKDLGIDIIWVSPMYQSPQFDMGYDISNYEEVYPPYGTVANMEELIRECHGRGIRLILDLVVNHTSHEHAWFQESKSSKDHPKRNWYIWRPPKYDKHGKRAPPNNWRSIFSGSAWEWDEHTQEYYLHLFAKEQPDLNWECDAARAAIYDSAIRFWLEKGIDGFRVDTVNMYSKGTELPDAPIADPGFSYQPAHTMFANGPRMHEFLREIHQKILSKYDTMTVGELPYTPDPDQVLRYVSAADPQLNMVFQFDILELDFGLTHKYGDYRPVQLTDFKQTIAKWQRFIEGTDGWTTAFCENHDQGRSVSRFASDLPEWHVQSAKLLATLMTTLTGSLFIYQGQEIGMINAPKDWGIEEYQDIESVNFYKEVVEHSRGDPIAISRMMESIQMLGRDHPRLPMQWDATKHAGFTTADKPWMRLHDIYGDVNVARQIGDPSSVLSYWKQMLRLRKEHKDLLIYGDFDLLEPANPETFIFTKCTEKQLALVALNFTQVDQAFRHTMEEALRGREVRLLVSSHGTLEDHEMLRPYEGRVYLHE